MILLASDFDGTMHFHDSRGWGYIPKANITSVQSFQSAGNLFGFCTGRPMEGLLRDIDEQIKPDFIISSTGSVISRGKDMNSLLYIRTIPAEDLASLVSRFAHNYDLIFHAVRKVYTVESVTTSYREQNLITPEELLHHQINGISVFAGNPAAATELTEVINRDYPDIHAFQNRDWLDIVAKGVSKGNALEKVKELFHADESAGIGDAENDITMLQAADISFTFASSVPLVQKEADYLVNSVADAVNILMKNEKNHS